ncbi:immunity 26/phosphotriesterase HocA family protein [Bradyrhizobium sp. HKCCYLS20291]|uniref:immunity 26/phosphotriesterase HocA family protein n=1 Tax=Bradyrhizobium sp. HKCCYLS20291 TaxID=3420766 RepID=UPI003EBA00BD
MKQTYREGAVFLVPLRDGGFARGVVARTPLRARKILLGYFFGPRLISREAASFAQLAARDAILFARCGDLRPIDGSWPVLGGHPSWNRSDWPFPDFVRRDPLTSRAYLVRYLDTDPRKIEFERPIDPDCDLPRDGLWGSGAVELILTKLLAASRPDGGRATDLS